MKIYSVSDKTCPTFSQHLTLKYGEVGEKSRKQLEKRSYRFMRKQRLKSAWSGLPGLCLKILFPLAMLFSRKKRFIHFKKQLRITKPKFDWLKGHIGRTITDLKTQGKILVHGKTYPARSIQGFIPKDQEVVITGNELSELLVGEN